MNGDFRIFNKKSGKYVDFGESDVFWLLEVQSGEVGVIPKLISAEDLSDRTIRIMSVSEYVELEQYTGRKDRNGKKIYAGDILKVRYWDSSLWDEDDEWTTENMLVKWNSHYAGWEPFVFQIDIGDCYYNYTVNSVEVVGNIHFNKEMLVE